ncbi:MAG: DALR anticodon-binding domain-containing protein, partial [Syntrophales bacterium]|nr:DALR anticodon-binding domain-containing protein [Syntrophales bacterium]
QALAGAFNMLENILKGFPGGAVERSLFRADAERLLYEAFVQCRGKADGLLAAGDLNGALREMATLRKPVDEFFDKVMVMDKDEAIRNNRLSLLWEMSRLFYKVADLSRIVTEG